MTSCCLAGTDLWRSPEPVPHSQRDDPSQIRGRVARGPGNHEGMMSNSTVEGKRAKLSVNAVCVEGPHTKGALERFMSYG